MIVEDEKKAGGYMKKKNQGLSQDYNEVTLDDDVEDLQKDIFFNLDQKYFPHFYVWKSGTVNTGDHYPLIFNEIEYNDGNMYDSRTGKVKIAYSGMYIFSTSFYKYPDTEDGEDGVQVSIYINGEDYIKSKT